MVSLIYPLSKISFKYNFSSTIFGVLMRYGVFDIGVNLEINSIAKSPTLLGKNIEI